MLYFSTAYNSKDIDIWSHFYKNRDGLEVKKRHFVWCIQYAKVEESNSRAYEVILHLLRRRNTRVSIPPRPRHTGWYIFIGAHMARRESERGTSCPGTFLARGRSRGRTDEWIVHSDVSRVRRCTRIAFPLGLLPIFVGCPLIGKNRLDGFAADFTACSNDLWRWTFFFFLREEENFLKNI